MRLYLIRHPRTVIADGICYGQSDVVLAGSPESLAQQLRRRLPAGLPLFSSPLRRCLELALHLDSSPRVDARLSEMHFGDWEMQAWDAIDHSSLLAWAADPLHFTPPGGESAANLMARVADFLASCHHDAVLVTHGGVIRAAHGWMLGTENWFSGSYDFGSLTVLEGK